MGCFLPWQVLDLRYKVTEHKGPIHSRVKTCRKTCKNEWTQRGLEWECVTVSWERAYRLWFCVVGEAKGLLKAAMRTSCLRPPLGLTPRASSPAFGVLFFADRLLDAGVRPGVAQALGVRRGVGVAARATGLPGVRRGVVDTAPSSCSPTRPGVDTRHSSCLASLVLCSRCDTQWRRACLCVCIYIYIYGGPHPLNVWKALAWNKEFGQGKSWKRRQIPTDS